MKVSFFSVYRCGKVLYKCICTCVCGTLRDVIGNKEIILTLHKGCLESRIRARTYMSDSGRDFFAKA